MRVNCKKMALILTFSCMTAAFTGCNGPGAAEVYHQMPVMNKQKQSETIFATVMRGDLKEEKTIRLSAKAGQKSSLSFQISDIGYDAFYVTAGDKVKKGQILARLLEQLFTTIPAAVGGSLTGFIATKLYIPLIDVTYASGTAKTLPAKIMISPMDMLQLGIILVLAFALCMYIVSRIISHMQIAQALKLGEE